ncbi:hypothetical protein BJI47_03080 [Rhodococcus sp. 1168]|nr:hypothetical protein BJI47_03080 [Rhodococcus sp. 1168]
MACGHIGMVPGLDEDHMPLCLRCSEIPLDLTCTRCGTETWLAKAKTCWRCLLDDIVRDLLSGPDGVVLESLEPLATAIVTMPRANSGVTWIRANPKVRELLAALGDGSVDPTHEALDALPRTRTVEYLRGLMVEHGVVPPRDRLLATYERWLHDKLATTVDDDSRKIVERFGRWHHLRKLREYAAAGPVRTGSFLRAKQSTTVAISFLNWLNERGTALADCSQHDIDAWYATGPSTRQHAERFLYWARSNKLTPKLAVPRHTTGTHELIGETERLHIIRTLLLHDDLPAVHRIAGCLLTLYGQSITRIVALTIDDVRSTSSAVSVKLTDTWVELPEPISHLLRQHLEKRPNTNTASNATSRWLFPGTMPGEHLNRQTVIDALRYAGIPSRAVRNSTWQQLVRQAPPQVLADALGISATTAMQHAERAGADWARYASISRKP